MKFPHSATVNTATGSHALHLAVARSSWARFHGLMLRGSLATKPVTQGLLITRCPSVHTLFMRYAIDVVYLSKAQDRSQNTTQEPPNSTDSTYTVTHLAPQLKPWRASIGKAYTISTLKTDTQTDTLADGHTGIETDAGTNTPTILKSAHALELPAGSIAALGIARGDTLSLAP